MNSKCMDWRDRLIITSQLDSEFESRYPIAGAVVDGREVIGGPVPNMDSIGASVDDYDVLKGIREVPMAEFTSQPVRDARTLALMEEIQRNRQIKPLIVVIDGDGPYVLEGGHRFDALLMLQAKSFPAVVVLDRSDIERSPQEYDFPCVKHPTILMQNGVCPRCQQESYTQPQSPE